ncbi:hypothetical protein ACFX5U_03680 [Sphingobacterium sp. SG20118]|uniref:hypothetical protein n=1 Tax=Sphingobacterium sp. SG20118 TaxID=3367156 RepID=UPI0037DFC4FC
MKIIISLIFIFFWSKISAQTMNLNKQDFENAYVRYKEHALQSRRFKHQAVVDLINKHQDRQVLHVTPIGKSVQQRAIYELTYGQGKKKVMLWSQMHGDEPTATMALFDLFNFLEGKDDSFEPIRNHTPVTTRNSLYPHAQSRWSRSIYQKKCSAYRFESRCSRYRNTRR